MFLSVMWIIFCLFIFVGLGFELRASHVQSRWFKAWAISPVLFCSGHFGDGGRGLELIAQAGLEPLSLWISASQAAGITGVSHQCWAPCGLFWVKGPWEPALKRGPCFPFVKEIYIKEVCICSVWPTVLSHSEVLYFSSHRHVTGLPYPGTLKPLCHLAHDGI
jgi:hypothetical protein